MELNITKWLSSRKLFTFNSFTPEPPAPARADPQVLSTTCDNVSFYGRLRAVSYFSLQSYCTQNLIQREKADCKQSIFTVKDNFIS